jgi:hypothetical protein
MCVAMNRKRYECTQGDGHLLQWRPGNLSEQRGRWGVILVEYGIQCAGTR